MTEFTCYLPEGATSGIGIGCAPVGVIEQVENFDAELQPLNLPSYWEVLAYPDVPIPKTRVAQTVTRLHAEGAWQRLRKCVPIEPSC